MNRRAAFSLAAFLLAAAAEARTPLVIAHRGASGYVPEHTLIATAMAHAMRPDHIEQDVVLTRDGVPVILHDHHLDTVTDVARVFPGRQRKDGRYYVIDFTWAELRRLTVHERVDLAKRSAVFPGRFPVVEGLPLRIPSLEQAILLIEGMNQSTDRRVGLYVEIKEPRFHQREGKDIVGIVLKLLARHGYTRRDDPIYVQCFDPETLKAMRKRHRTKLKLVQLIDSEAPADSPDIDYPRMLTERGLAEVARFADGIGPWIPQLYEAGSDGVRPNRVVEWAHRSGLEVHPYTARVDQVPPPMESFDELSELLFRKLDVDGVFTDFPDRTAAYLERIGRRRR